MNPRYAVLTVLYCGAIFWMSSHPLPVDTGPQLPGVDKLAHAALYGGLAAVVSVGLRRRTRRPPSEKVQFLAPFLFAALYGITDEIHQYFVPERHCDARDALANAIGAFIVQAILCRWVWGRPNTGSL